MREKCEKKAAPKGDPKPLLYTRTITPRKGWTLAGPGGGHPPPILASLSTMAAVRTLASRTVFRRLVLREWWMPSIWT